MPVPLLDLNRDHEPLRAAFDQALARVLESGRFILGEEVTALEREVADFLGVAHAVGVSSGSDALVCALLAADCGPGDEVITTPFSFFATVESILRVGATPRFVDIDPNTLMLSLGATERALARRTKAILPVHLYGHAARVDQLGVLAERASVALIEDTAQAFGATLSGRALGAWGHFGCFSFFPTKPLGGLGDGGMVVTNDADLDRRLRRLRVHGASGRHAHDEWSGNYRLDALQAALLRVKLPHVPEWQKRRGEHVARYLGGLGEVAAIAPLQSAEGELPCHSLFTVRIVDGSRERLVAFLHEHGVETAVHYPTPLYAQAALSHVAVDASEFPNTERACREVLSLPLFASMTPAEVDRVVELVKRFFA